MSDSTRDLATARVLNCRELPPGGLMASVDALAARIRQPLAKLKFIQSALDRYQSYPPALKAPLLRGLAMRLAAYDALAEIRDQRPTPPRLGWTLYRLRYPLGAMGAISVATLIGALGWYGYQAGTVGVQWLAATFAAPAAQVAPPPPVASATEPGPSSSPRRLAPTPISIWLVEKRPDGELWSNGLRILTTFETKSEKRHYLRFRKDGGDPENIDQRPIGILFHTTENDMAPFAPDFNRSILRTTENLLRYLAKRGYYNYMVDRFGRVYRLLPDSDVAAHAGFSVWADSRYLYLNLNESFIGVSFESQWSPQPGEAEILTAPQIQSGLNLTDMLRAQHAIADENCTTHGLVSVNPTKMLIGHHRDWAKGFPFADFRLTDKYLVPVPSVLDVGFRYDEHFLAEMKGELWPGLEKASVEFEQRAAAKGMTAEALQNALRKAYRERLELLTKRAATGAKVEPTGSQP